MEPKNGFNLKLAICIALFSFANYVTQPLYSAFVPVLLQQRLASTTQIGLVLSCCNFLALLIHPLVGRLSDRTRCRFGRRRPYILAGAVSCSVCFVLIPLLNSLWQFALVLALYSLTVSFWRAPIGAIQIDCVQPEYITRSNAVASCMLALSSVFAYFSGNRLTASGLELRWVFAVGGFSAVAAAVVGCITVKEQDSRNMPSTISCACNSAAVAFLTLSRRSRRCMAVMLLAVLLAYMANTAFEFFFVLYTMERMTITAGTATMYLGIYMAGYFIVALLSGSSCRPKNSAWWATRSLLAAACVQLLMLFSGFTASSLAALLIPLCLVYGACWGCFNIYVYPLWLSFCTPGNSGNLMGLFFVCTGLAATFAPTLYGIIHDISHSYFSLFVFCAATFSLAALALSVSLHRVRGRIDK